MSNSNYNEIYTKKSLLELLDSIEELNTMVERLKDFPASSKCINDTKIIRNEVENLQGIIDKLEETHRERIERLCTVWFIIDYCDIKSSKLKYWELQNLAGAFEYYNKLDT